ncbi:aryl-phospho-beta-D-glucosidase BglC (GH1 family)/chitodextrinase [Actinoplanes lutulentus]|uniref:cellulase n=1 Tax=Actinoplanes lutulentus TaxID=1287878 RepID=A0A327YWR2_9ACTN|nr:cellulase family glycosylhydrolase [Actinoplanes lutulentus]MBB2947515.1 aryl-phospho-beta-D-glucosidase BglC (GH1 family)/chitodextrinase [Actinoplanes lutulentus]RAK25671.1 aryl-phospho-beta-D-glucosidase BglC (GH1 family) [Actinoplanes lutulentus]
MFQRRGRKRLAAAVAAVALALTGGQAFPAAAPAAPAAASAALQATAFEAAAAPGSDWLHVDGNQIVDAAGNPVWLTGVNWFGFNASERVFHGLWSANITEITRSMAQRGINIVRVPISTQLLLEWKAGTFGTVNVNTYANPELTGKNSLQIFDYWLALCEQYGIKVLLDVHSAEADNSGHIHPVWYKGTITPELYYQAWEWVTARYKANDTIVAMDLKNEPHGTPGTTPRAKWDNSTDVDNWKYTAETAAKRILAINPEVLVLVEGQEVYPREGETWSSPNTDPDLSPNYYYNWWGGNLRGVRDYPINLGANQDQLVYSPHDYGPLVFNQPWFDKPFDKTSLTNDVWRPNWLYIHENDTAPLLIGEWGGRLGQDERQDRWMTALRDLIVEHRLHQTFWVLNPNSGDTGGLLLDDWKTWDEQKYALLKPALWQQSGKFVSLDHEVALGGAGSTTGISLSAAYGSADTVAPSVPGQPASSSITSTGVTLTWAASTDNVGVTSYDVLRGGSVVATVSGTTYNATGLTANTAYSFTVRARDAAGNVSAASTARSVTTAASGGGGGDGGCTATYRTTSSWSGGFQAEVTVRNTGTAAGTSWVVNWTYPSGTTVASLWNGVQGTPAVTVRNADHNGALAGGASAAFGLVGTGTAATPATVSCTLS